MSPMSVWPSLVATALALGVAFLLARGFGHHSAPGRFVTLDGLRGFLAFFVFLHHSALSYFRCHPNEPGGTLPRFYEHLGQNSVALFFMVTGFLFFSKLLEGRSRPVDWLKLYVGRVLRLVPLYWFAIGVVFLIVACLSDFTIREPVYVLAKNVFWWMSFTVVHTPDLNGVLHTRRIIWSVMWTLRYEWLFYLSLPLVALCLRVKVPVRYVALSCLLVAGFVLAGVSEIRWLAAFAGGIAAAFLVRSEKFRTLAVSRMAAAIVLGCLAVAFCLLPADLGVADLLILSVAFCLIAGGSTMFGVFAWSSSRMLGEMCYSMYLLHGLLLFSVFELGFGLDRAARFSPVEHWLIILGCVPVLVSLCFITFRFIEAPAMKSAPAVSARLHALGQRWRILSGLGTVDQDDVSATKILSQPPGISLAVVEGAEDSRDSGKNAP